MDRAMKSIIMRITLFSVFLFFLLSLPGYPATERRTALVIGNSSYNTGSLRNPGNDADDMASALKRLGFDVILKKNTTLQDMEDAIRNFGDRLKKGGVGLFFYAGHGVQIAGKNFLLPIGAKIDRDTDVKYRAVDADMVLDEMGNAGNPMNIVILDACRDNPFGKSFRTASRGLAIISSAPRGTLVSYSTSPGNIAADGSSRNSPYTGSLIKHMTTPGLQIEEVFKNVRQDLGRMTQGKQIPWELSSLEGKFYFRPQGSNQNNLTDAPSYAPRPESDELVRQKEALEWEKERNNELKELNAKLAELNKTYLLFQKELKLMKPLVAQGAISEMEVLRLEREAGVMQGDIEQTKQAIMMIIRAKSVSTANEIRRDGRFIAYEDGTVLDTNTNLMWAAKDNGTDINWTNAKSYCENYRGGGYTDWRMPTQDELVGLYDASKSRPGACDRSYNISVATELINITCFVVYASNETGGLARVLFFKVDRNPREWDARKVRALPVRSVK
jgi:uncharacterized caspase-like protein